MRRFIWASYGMYLLGGMSGVVFGSIMTELLKHYHATYSSGGFIVFLQAIGFMTGVPLVSFLIGRYHYKYILSASAFAIAAAQLLIFFLPSIQWVYLLAILNGCGASALETAVASYIMEAFVGQRAIFMSRLEVSFGLGSLGMPFIASALIAFDVWRLSFLVMGGFALLLAIVWQTITFSLQEVQPGKQLDAQTAAPPVFHNRRIKIIVLSFFLFMIFVYVGIEGSINSFMPSIFITYLKTVPYFASLSTSVFWAAMVAGRTAIGWVARRLNYERYLLWSIAGTILFMLLLTQAHLQWACYVIVFGLGMAMSAIYSITMVFANHTFPGLERLVTSLVTAFAGIGGAVLPAVIGFAMDHFTPDRILWMIVGFTVLLLATLLTIFVLLHNLRKSTKFNLDIKIS